LAEEGPPRARFNATPILTITRSYPLRPHLRRQRSLQQIYAQGLITQNGGTTDARRTNGTDPGLGRGRGHGLHAQPAMAARLECPHRSGWYELGPSASALLSSLEAGEYRVATPDRASRRGGTRSGRAGQAAPFGRSVINRGGVAAAMPALGAPMEGAPQVLLRRHPR
jgi:hypothetical protein